MEKKSQKRQMEEIYNIGRDVVREWAVILCVALSVALWAFIISSVRYEPVYTSSTTFVVTAKGTNTGAYDSMSKTQRMTEIFQSVMDSQVLKKKVAETQGMESFSGRVSIAVVPETNLLTVSVTGDSPEIAFRLLRGMLDNYMIVSKNVLGDVVMEVFEEPNYPSYPDNPYNGSDIMKKAFVLAAAFMICVYAVISYMKDSIKTEEDVPEKLDTTLFATLEHETHYRDLKSLIRRNKKPLLLNQPTVSFSFAETVKKMRTKLLYHCSKADSKILFVTSVGKKEGKTTIAANLAYSMAMRNKNVLLIEGDLRKSSITEYFGAKLPAGAGLTDIDDHNLNIKSKVFQLEGTTLFLLPNNVPHMKTTEFLESSKFARFLEEMKRKMDFIVIDGPPAKGRADAEILARKSDASLIVVKQNYVKVPFVNDTIDMLNGYGQGVLGCVLNDLYASHSIISSGYGYGKGYGRYTFGKYGKYEKYGRYGKYLKYMNAAEQVTEIERQAASIKE